MKPLVYVAGPYSSPDPVENTNRAIRAGMDLWETGKVAVIIPHLSLAAHLVEPRPVDYWYELDIDQLAHCHAVFRLPGASTGADAEVEYAKEKGIPVFTDLDELLDWTTTGQEKEA